MKYIGTGHADLTKWEWGTNMQRDSLASHIGHYSRLAYMAIADNETIARMKYKFLMVNNL
jgi:splicing factor 3B subunit 5